MRILFVTHDTSNYGASKSLQALIAALKDKNILCELVVRRRILGTYNYNDLKNRFSVDTVHTLWLPFWSCFVGRKQPLSIKENIWLKLNNFLSKFSNNVIIDLALKRDIDVIHLNSIVLIDIVSDKFPFVIHVRELMDLSFHDLMANKIKNARGVVCIDDVVSEPLRKFEIRNLLMLSNPYGLNANLEILNSTRYNDFIERTTKKYVIAIIGYVKDEKGINFILDFLKTNDDNRFVFAVIGQGELFPACKSFERNDPRLIAYGEEDNISNIYRYVDLVVRGDDVPRVGRTIYEAIYSGTNVLIPGNKSDYPSELFEKFSESICLYKTRDLNDFCKQINTLVNRGKTLRRLSQNTQYNTHTLIDFYQKVIN
jgi:hypothetical protein